MIQKIETQMTMKMKIWKLKLKQIKKTTSNTNMEDNENQDSIGSQFIQAGPEGNDIDNEIDGLEEDEKDVEQDDTYTGKEHEEIENEDASTRGENMENTTEQNIEEIEDAGPEIEDRENAYSSETEDGTLTEIKRITKK